LTSIIIPGASGLQARLLELGTPIEDWQTKGGTVRLDDFSDAWATWFRGDIFFGRGFIERPSHNIFLGILVETGLVGLLLFVSFWLTSTLQFLRNTSLTGRRPATGMLRIAILSGLLCVLTQQNISGGSNAGNLANLLLGLILGVSAYENFWRREGSQHNTRIIPHFYVAFTPRQEK
jgi:hypothetical protein